MTLRELHSALDVSSSGEEMYARVEQLYPICRSISGEGLRRSFSILQQSVPLQIHEVPSGTQVFDWVIPEEWNIRDAYVADSTGQRVIDYRRHTLHVMSYSTPVRRRMSLAELRPHLHTLPQQPDLVPYRTAYYQPNWGFCLSQNDFDRLREDEYEVVIDATLADGSLSYAQLLLPGAQESEVLISTHCCHPSMCNDNLSGMALCATLAALLSQVETRYSYRFVFVPGTIGSIAWLAQHQDVTGIIRHGLVVACVGDDGAFTYKQSRRGNAEIDRAVEAALKQSEHPFTIRPFTPYGYDERQYCSPGFNLPVGALSRTPHGEFAQYHTSADDLDLVSPRRLGESLQLYLDALSVLEDNRTYRNLSPWGEPQLGRRGLYSPVGGRKVSPDEELALLWVLNQSDGSHSLLDIAERSQMSFDSIRRAAATLGEHGLLEEVQP